MYANENAIMEKTKTILRTRCDVGKVELNIRTRVKSSLNENSINVTEKEFKQS
jgi:hypothetical protein